MTSWPAALDYASFKKTVENITLLEKTGTLEIRDKKTGQSYYFYIKNGEIIYIEGHPVCLEHRIGDTLLRQGLITEAQLRQALEKQKINTYEFLGDLLLKEGFISPKELLFSLTQQIENVLFTISLIRDGEFLFKEDETPDRMPQIPYTITLSNLLKIFLKSSEILVKMPFLAGGLNISLRINHMAVNIHDLNPLEQAVIDGFRKGHTIKDVLENAIGANHVTMLSVIADLYDRNILLPPRNDKNRAKEAPQSPGPGEMLEKTPSAKAPEKRAKTEKAAPPAQEPIPKPRYSEKPVEFVFKPEQDHPAPVQVPPPRPAPPVRKKPAPRQSSPPVKNISRLKTPQPGTYALAEILSFVAVLCLLILYLAFLRPLFKTPVTEHFSIMNPEALQVFKKERTLQMGRIYSHDELLTRQDEWRNPFYVRGEDIYSSGADEIPDTLDDFRVK